MEHLLRPSCLLSICYVPLIMKHNFLCHVSVVLKPENHLEALGNHSSAALPFLNQQVRGGA